MRFVPPEALALVKASEGFRASRNTDPTGNAEIGYGHKMVPGDPMWNVHLSEEGAEALAEEDLDKAAAQLYAVLGEPLIDNLKEGQWAALIDFVFNEGIGQFRTSTLCRFIQEGSFKMAALEFARWVYGVNPETGGEVIQPGLVTRRRAETALWNMP